MLRRPLAVVAPAVLIAVLVSGCSVVGKSATPSPSPAPAAATAATGSTARSTAGPASRTTSGSPFGVSTLSTTQLLARAHSVAADATGVRMVGTLQDPTGPIKIDIKYGQTGSSGRLTVNGNSVDIVEVGGAVYYRPSDAFFKAALGPDDAVDVLAVTAGRWITGGAGEPFFARMTPLVDRSKQLAIVFSVAGKMKRLAPRTVDGVPCLSLGDADGALYVSASDARPIRLAAADHSVLNFSDYGAVAEPVAPERINTVQAVDLGL